MLKSGPWNFHEFLKLCLWIFWEFRQAFSLLYSNYYFFYFSPLMPALMKSSEYLFQNRGYSEVYSLGNFCHFIDIFYSPNTYSPDNSSIFVSKHLIGQCDHMTRRDGKFFCCTTATGWVRKNSPPKVFWHFSPNGWEFFSPNFTRLLHVPIYDRLQNFIQLSATVTKLCHIKRDHHNVLKMSTIDRNARLVVALNMA